VPNSGFIEQEGHPDGHKPRADSGIVVLVFAERGVDDASVVRLADSLPRELQCAAQADVSTAARFVPTARCSNHNSDITIAASVSPTVAGGTSYGSPTS
jgi:hypothetical protein